VRFPLRSIMAWLGAIFVAKLCYLIYPQMHPMCGGQSWKSCIMSLDPAMFLLDPITPVVAALPILAASAGNIVWPKTKNLTFYIPLACAAGIIAALFFPAGYLDQIEVDSSDSFGMAGTLVVWIAALLLPYAVGSIFCAIFSGTMSPSSS
jgi:hypothetical protein